jgi:hypothetical protein
MSFTSKYIRKAIGLLIVSAFMFAQSAAASHHHNHDELDHAPEPSPCVICLAVSPQDYNVDLDVPPKPTSLFMGFEAIDFNFLVLHGSNFMLCRDDVNNVDPPDLRASKPRAPPH